MQYRVQTSATIGETEHFPETAIVKGDLLESDRTDKRFIDYCLARGYIYAPNADKK